MKEGCSCFWTFCKMLILSTSLMVSTQASSTEETSLKRVVDRMRHNVWVAAKLILETDPPNASQALIDYLLAVCWAYLKHPDEARRFAEAAKSDIPPLDERYVGTADLVILWA